jgi:predicted dinucleotide-binding enzyme
VVKTLNTVHVNVMVDPGRVPGQHNIFVSGDDATAKKAAIHLLEELGWQKTSVLDLGDIRTARGVEMYASLFFTLAGVLDTFDFNIAVVTGTSGV